MQILSQYIDEEYANYYEHEDSDDQVADEKNYDEHDPVNTTDSEYSNINMYLQQNKQFKFKYSHYQ